MDRLVLCADEHVPNAYETVLRSNGFTVHSAARERGERTSDETLLEWCATQQYVLFTNDRDFVELDAAVDHAGVIVYSTQTLTPAEVAKGVRRLDRHFSPETIRTTLVWLENWI